MASEAQRAHVVGAETASLLAARTAVERLLRDQGGGALKDLFGKGIISEILWHQSDEVRLWANMATHGDPEIINPPQPGEVEELLTYVDALLHAIYVEPANLKALQERRNTQST